MDRDDCADPSVLRDGETANIDRWMWADSKVPHPRHQAVAWLGIAWLAQVLAVERHKGLGIGWRSLSQIQSAAKIADDRGFVGQGLIICRFSRYRRVWALRQSVRIRRAQHQDKPSALRSALRALPCTVASCAASQDRG